MKISKFGAPIAIVAAASLALAGCATNEQPATNNSPGTTGAALEGTLTGKGASSMKAAQEKWIADFQTANPNVTVNYSPDGSGAGREAFIAGGAGFAGSDRALNDKEMGEGKFGTCAATSSALNLPVYISPIAIIFKIEGVNELKLDAETIAAIFKGDIKKWNDPKITALNEGVQLPDLAITAVHRADDSGTTENFTDYLNQAAPSVWDKEADGEWPYPGGEAANQTSGVVNAVKGGNGTIGYADASAAKDLGHVQVKVGNEFFGPTAEAAAKIVDASNKVEGRKEHDYALKLDRKAEGAYPIALVAYAIVCEEYKDSKVGTLVKAYVTYMISADGQKAANEAAGSAPLSSEYQTKLKAAIDSVK